MVEVLAIVRKEKTPSLSRALIEAGFPHVYWSVKGRGKEGGLRYKGLFRDKVVMSLIPKGAFSIWCEEQDVDKLINLIFDVTHTGAYGDGKIFLLGKEGSGVKMIKAVIRPEKVYDVIKALEKKGFKAMTMWDVVGRGKEGGVVVGETTYDELAKTMLMIAVNDEDVDKVIKILTDKARTGAYGDGKVFVCDISKVWTIRTKSEGL